MASSGEREAAEAVAEASLRWWRDFKSATAVGMRKAVAAALGLWKKKTLCAGAYEERLRAMNRRAGSCSLFANRPAHVA